MSAPNLPAPAMRVVPWLRAAIGLMWIVTGVISLGVYPREASYELLARSGMPDMLQPYALFGAALLDIILGVLCFIPRRPPWLWMAQAVLILFYTLVISIKLPEFWLHPYGPILKNVPILAVLVLLHAVDNSRRHSRRN